MDSKQLIEFNSKECKQNRHSNCARQWAGLGFTGLSTDVRSGAQGFRLNVNIKSTTASKEQISQPYEIGKKFSPAFDTLTNDTSVIVVNSS